MSRADTPIVASLEDVAVAFKHTASREGRVTVRCAYCDGHAKQVVADTARRWFVEHACTNQAPPSVTEPLDETRDFTFDLTLRDATVAWEEMTNMLLGLERSYGGHRHGLEPATPEAIEHAARIDAALIRILGGIPRSPARQSTVIEFPDRHVSLERIAA